MENRFSKGDCCQTNKGVKYLLETLEPEGIDSFSIGIFRYDVTAKKVTLSYVLRILQPRS
jgi:hypothetical protein